MSDSILGDLKPPFRIVWGEVDDYALDSSTPPKRVDEYVDILNAIPALEQERNTLVGLSILGCAIVLFYYAGKD